MTTTAREPREPSRREGRDSHGRRPHSSSRSRRDEPPSPRRRRDERRHESDRAHHHRRRAEEGADAGDRDERRNRPVQDAQARRDGPDPVRREGKQPDDPHSARWEGKRPDDPDPARWEGKRHDDPHLARWEGKRPDDPHLARWEGKRPDDPDPVHREGKPLGDVKDDPPARQDRSPRGTKRFSETREAWQPRSSFFQHDERDSAGHGGRRYGRQGSDYGRHRGQNEHLDDRDKHRSEGHGLQEKGEQAQQQSDVDSTWKHDGFFKLEEEAPVAKRRPGFKETGMLLEEQESAVTARDARSRKPDQPGLTSGMGEERRNYHSREFIRPDDRGTRRGFSDYRGAGQRNGYDSRGRFAGRGGRGRDSFVRDRFDYQYGGRNNMHEAAGEQTEKWTHDLYDQTDSTPVPMTEEEQIAKVEALLAL